MADAWESTPGAVEGAEPLGTVRLADIGRSVWRTTTQSRGSLSRLGRLAGEAARITAGRSAVAPDRRDWRFADPTWNDNGVYRRLMQYYLAWAQSMEEMVDAAELDWRADQRARFFMEILVSAAAPTNSLVGNPAAVKRAFETGGRSIAAGLRNLIDDTRHNGGLPSQVKRGAFVIGQDLAATPGSVVYRDEVCEVLQFSASTPEVRRRPLLMVPPQISKYYFMDLAPGRSFLEYVASRGITCFAISWRNPDARYADWDFDTYAAAVLRAVDVARDVARSDDVNVLGLCAGGILTATVLSHLADQRDDRVRTATFGVTLLDFSTPATISLFNNAPLLAAARRRSRSRGFLDGPSLGSVFSLASPERPRMELLGQRLPAREGPADLRHPRVELRFDQPPGGAAQPVPRHLREQHTCDHRGVHGARHSRRSRQGPDRELRHRAPRPTTSHRGRAATGPRSCSGATARSC